MKSLELFAKNAYFDLLTKEDQELLLENTTRVIFNKGDKLAKAGEFVNNVFFISSGYVKMHLDFTRRCMILDIYGPNQFIALGQTISLEKQPFDLTVLDETICCLTDIRTFREVVQNNNKFAMAILEGLTHSIMNYITTNLYSLTQNNIHGRLANILIYLSESVFHSSSFDMLLSRKELSQLCNISRENVIKVLYEFNNEGVISLNGKFVQINSLENLKRISTHG
jgi:CRP/FNR family transcriptional regulator, polysaccharide utilization system transcription regulator